MIDDPDSDEDDPVPETVLPGKAAPRILHQSDPINPVSGYIESRMVEDVRVRMAREDLDREARKAEVVAIFEAYSA